MKKHGHKRTKENRKLKKKLVMEKAKKNIAEIWQSHLDNILSLDDQDYDYIYTIYKEIDLAFLKKNADVTKKINKGPEYLTARRTLATFVYNFNKENNTNLPIPFVPTQVHRSKPIINEKLFFNGKKITNLLTQAHGHWQETSSFNFKQSIAWALFSAIYYGGMLDKKVVVLFYDWLIDTRKKPLGFNQSNLFINFDVEDSYYGNAKKINTTFDENNVQDEKETLTRGYQFVVDPITALWVYRIKHLLDIPKEIPSISACFAELDSILGTGFAKKELLNCPEFRYAHYFILTEPNSKIDPMMVSVLSSSINCTALSQKQFKVYQETFSIKRQVQLSSKFLLPNHRQNKNQEKDTKKRSHAEVISELRKVINTARFSNQVFDDLLETYNNENEKRLISWVRFLKTERGNKNNTIKTYFSFIANDWIYFTSGLDLDEMDTEDFEDLYQEILDNNDEAVKPDKRYMFHRFHKYQVQYHDAAEYSLGDKKQHSLVRSHLVSPRLYDAMLTSIDHMVGADANTIMMYKLIVILGYRCGLRRSEVVGLRIKHIEQSRHTPEYVSLIIVNEKFNTLKTYSSNRRLPLFALLTDAEKALFHNYLSIRKQVTNKDINAPFLVFSGNTQPVNKSFPNELVTRLYDNLLATDSKEHKVTYHGLRHSTANNLFLVLNGDPDLISIHTGYTPEQAKKIRQAIVHAGDIKQNKWIALAHLMGHLEAKTTFTSYIHHAHLVAGKQLADYPRYCDSEVIRKISGLDRRSVNYYLKKDEQPPQAGIYTNALLSFFYKKMVESVDKLKTTDKEFLPPKNIKENPIKSFFRYYSIDNILMFLKKMEVLIAQENHTKDKKHVSTSIRTASEYSGISLSDANKFYQRACDVANIKTTNNKSKLCKQDNQLLPIIKTYCQDEETIKEAFFTRAAKMASLNPDKLLYFLATFLNNYRNSTQLRFPFKKEDQARRFLAIGIELIDAKNWRISCPNIADARKIKPKGMKHKNVKLHQEIGYKGYTISMVHPLENDRDKFDGKHKIKRSSVLNYVCHLTLICWMEADEVIDEL